MGVYSIKARPAGHHGGVIKGHKRHLIGRQSGHPGVIEHIKGHKTSNRGITDHPNGRQTDDGGFIYL